MPNSPTEPIFTDTFTVPAEAIDENGHFHNVHYVQWMQEVAVRHYEFIGGLPPTQALGATWVVREHHIQYLSPAFLGDVIEVRTWVVDLRRVRSLRRYEFVRVSDGKTLVKGETAWVFVEATSGRPLAVPPEVVGIFPMKPDAKGASHQTDG